MKAHGRRVTTLAVPLTVALTGWWGALAGELTFKKTIDVGGNGLAAFDISFVDPKIELYILADRTNASVDLVDSEDATFLDRVGSVCPAGNPAPHFCFQGSVLNPDGTASTA